MLPDEFLVRTGTGEPLAAMSVPDDALAGVRTAFRSRARALMLGVVVVVLLLATGPLLDWRRLTRTLSAATSS